MFVTLVTAAMLTLPAVPKSECVTKYGRTVCGYDCKTAYGRTKCAKTPQGRCTVSYGRIKCWDPAGTATSKPGKKPKADCITAYGRTACGYGCIKAHGRIRCAKTPGARCWYDLGRIKCTDDDKIGPGKRPPKGGPGQADCVSAHGRTVCGYHCLAKYGVAKCAKTPAGVCYAKFGRVVCWDPPFARPGQPRAQCVGRYGAIACGYQCRASYGQAKCAKTPEGVCKAAYGRITCWDPPRKKKDKTKADE